MLSKSFERHSDKTDTKYFNKFQSLSEIMYDTVNGILFRKISPKKWGQLLLKSLWIYRNYLEALGKLWIREGNNKPLERQ